MQKKIVFLYFILWTALYSSGNSTEDVPGLIRTSGTIRHLVLCLDPSETDAPATQEKGVPPKCTSPLTGEDIAPKQFLPKEPSFSHDASPLKVEGQETNFDVITTQLLLSSLTGNVPSEKNLGLYAFRFFIKTDAGISVKDVVINHDPFKEGEFDEESMPGDNFDAISHLLEEHCDPENTNLCNLFQCMALADTNPSRRKNSAQIFFHSEQRILIHVRSSLTKELAKMSRDGNLKNLCTVALHIYSTNDPCYNCGSSIQYVIQKILRQQVKTFFEKIAISANTILKCTEKKEPTNGAIVTPSAGITFPDDFSVFAVISSSKTYKTPFDSWKRGSSVEKESVEDYFTSYVKNKSVKEGCLDISSLDGKSLYFWVPSLKDIELTLSSESPSTELAVTVKKKESGFGNFYQLINVVGSPQCLAKITILKINPAIEFSTSGDLGTISPRNIGKLTQLRSLDLASTNARSAYLSKMFTPLRLLVSLNLNGAIVSYRDEDSTKKKPKRTKLFEAIGKLPLLEQLNAENNNIDIDEFCIWIENREKMLNKINRLNLANNHIFNMTPESVEAVNTGIDTFITARPDLKIDLKSNGNIPVGLILDANKIITSDGSAQAQVLPQQQVQTTTQPAVTPPVVAAAAAQTQADPLLTLTDTQWNEIKVRVGNGYMDGAYKLTKRSVTNVKNNENTGYALGSNAHNAVLAKARELGYIA